MVIVVLLVARVPPLERAIGQGRLVGWHRRLGPWPPYLLAGHAVFITVGTARAAHDGVLHQLRQLLWTYPRAVAATAGGALLIAAGVTSYRLARRRMAYETYHRLRVTTGDAMKARYGPAQVRVTVSNGKIMKIEAVQLQNGDAKSRAISSKAAPILQQSVLAKQTAAVDTVSGATYTSLSYEASLQSALDKAAFKAPDDSTASTDVSQLQ
jgi:uncharacterized protein with FMN-binding domain